MRAMVVSARRPYLMRAMVVSARRPYPIHPKGCATSHGNFLFSRSAIQRTLLPLVGLARRASRGRLGETTLPNTSRGRLGETTLPNASRGRLGETTLPDAPEGLCYQSRKPPAQLMLLLP